MKTVQMFPVVQLMRSNIKYIRYVSNEQTHSNVCSTQPPNFELWLSSSSVKRCYDVGFALQIWGTWPYFFSHGTKKMKIVDSTSSLQLCSLPECIRRTMRAVKKFWESLSDLFISAGEPPLSEQSAHRSTLNALCLKCAEQIKLPRLEQTSV